MSIEHDIKLQISKINEYSLVMKRMAKIDMFMVGECCKIRLRFMMENLSDIDEKIIFSSEYNEEILAFLRGMVEMYYILR